MPSHVQQHRPHNFQPYDFMLNCSGRTAIALEHGPRKARVPQSFGLCAATILSVAAHAGPLSDPFHTDAQLQRDTKGLTDPSGHGCAIPGGNLTFPAAVSLALCRNPQTRSAWAQAHQQAAALGISESAWLPSISATASESRDFGQIADVNGNIESGAQNSGDVTANLTWTLYDFGARSGRI